MDLVDMIDDVFLAQKYRIPKPKILDYIDLAQKLAFKKELEAFKVYRVVPTVSGTLSYSFAAYTIPVRKFVGVTNLSDAQIAGIDPIIDTDYDLDEFSNPTITENIPCTIDVFGKTFSFIQDPGTTTTTYRAVYYRQPETLQDNSDDALVILPEQYHMNLVNAASRICDFLSYQEPFGEADLAPFFAPFWKDMEESLSTTDKFTRNKTVANLP